MARELKDQQLNLRVSAQQRESLERAAELEGIPLSTLILYAAEERAVEVLRAHSSMAVPEDIFDALLARLDEPAAEPAPALAKALEQLDSVVDRR